MTLGDLLTVTVVLTEILVHQSTAKIEILHVVALVIMVLAHLNHVTGMQTTTANTRGETTGIVTVSVTGTGTGTATSTGTVTPTGTGTTPDALLVNMIDLLAGTGTVTTAKTITGTRKDPVGLLHLTKGTDMIDAIVTMIVARTDQDLVPAGTSRGKYADPPRVIKS